MNRLGLLAARPTRIMIGTSLRWVIRVLSRQGRTRPGLPHRRGRRVTAIPRHPQARQETGGSSRCTAGPGSAVAESGVDDRIVTLQALTTGDLRIEWQRLYRVTPPTRLSRDLLIRGVTYKLQEEAHGGLGYSTRRMLRSLADGSDKQSGSWSRLIGKPERWHRSNVPTPPCATMATSPSLGADLKTATVAATIRH